MNSIVQLWETNRELLKTKKLQQILSFTGDGKLRDSNSTSLQFREFLSVVPNPWLSQYATECLQDSFADSGMALQDIINEVGSRLGFEVIPGVYRGRTDTVGFDGLWKSEDEHALIVEVKTTDAYRINLNTIVEYRKKLITKDCINSEQSSVLIIVGRQDTGDLEAQIRGSRHAWDIRLMSTDSLLSLLALKDKLNDPRTVHQINEVLKPREYTRIDKLVELIFMTAKDVGLQTEEPDDDISPEEPISLAGIVEKKTSPANFHQECADKIEAHLDNKLIKESRSAYMTRDKKIGVNLAISKLHQSGSTRKYWFAYHTHQREFLESLPTKFVAFGCGSSQTIFLIPFEIFDPLRSDLWTTERNERIYWHVVIYERPDGFELQLPLHNSVLNLNEYRLPNEV